MSRSQFLGSTILAIIGIVVFVSVDWSPSSPSPSGLNESEVFDFISMAGEEQPDWDAAPARSERIDVLVRYVATSVFSQSAKDEKVIRGQVRNVRKFLEVIQNNRASSISHFGAISTTSGRAADFSHLITRPDDADDGVNPVNRVYGIRAFVTPTLRRDGRIHVHVDFTDSSLSGMPAKAGTMPVRATESMVVGDNGTFLIGGIKVKFTDYETNAVPLLSRLPGIGSSFESSREVEVEREVMILTTVNRFLNSEPRTK